MDVSNVSREDVSRILKALKLANSTGRLTITRKKSGDNYYFVAKVVENGEKKEVYLGSRETAAIVAVLTHDITGTLRAALTAMLEKVESDGDAREVVSFIMKLIEERRKVVHDIEDCLERIDKTVKMGGVIGLGDVSWDMFSDRVRRRPEFKPLIKRLFSKGLRELKAKYLDDPDVASELEFAIEKIEAGEVKPRPKRGEVYGEGFQFIKL